MKYKIHSLLLAVLLFSGTVSAQTQPPYFVSPEGGDPKLPQNGLSWKTAVTSVNNIVNNSNVQGDVVIFVKAGNYGPILINNQNIRSIRIYGGFAGFEIDPSERDLANPANRTVIHGVDDGSIPAPYYSAALTVVINNSGLAHIDGLTMRGNKSAQQTMTLRVLRAWKTIVNRCRFEGSDGPGWLISNEGIPGGDRRVSVVNSVIAGNKCSCIAACCYSFKFINTTIADNQCDELMCLWSQNKKDLYEISNSIVFKTSVDLGNFMAVDVYNSVFDVPFKFNGDDVDNIVGVAPPFVGSDNPAEPFACYPNPYTECGGDYSRIGPYIDNYIIDDMDIVGNDRMCGDYKIGIGAYQGFIDKPVQGAAEYVSLPPSDNAGSQSAAISIYPTDIVSGETLCFVNPVGARLTARICSISGTAVCSASISSAFEALPLSCSPGIYIVLVTDDATGGLISRQKITVR